MDHKEPDRVPYMMTFVPEVTSILQDKYKNELASIGKDEEHKYQGTTGLDIVFGHDMLLVTYGISTGYYRETGSDTYIDEWNITWKKIPYTTPFGIGNYTEIVRFPLAEEGAIDTYIPPNPDNEDMGYVEAIVERFGKEKYICGVINCSMFEGVKYLRGITQSLIDIIADKDLINRILDILMDYHLKLGLKLIDRGVDIIWTADDVGAEHTMIISPELFREIQKPRMAYMIGELKKRNKNVKFAWHSDGYIEPIIDDLVEVGVDLLNPIQPESMDPSAIKKRYGKNIALWGTVSTQSTFPFGTAEDVRNEVRDRIRTCAPGGGFLLAPTHNIQLDVPFENIQAFYKALELYGAYPIRC